MSKSKIILIHSFIWVVLLTGVFLMSFGTPYLLGAKTIAILMVHAVVPVVFYCSYFFVPKILQSRKYIFITATVMVTVFCSLWLWTGELIGAFYLFGIPFFWLILGGISGYFIDWFKKDKKQMELENKNVESELSLLKSQINPHFLFNTLNNIDALISADSEKASKMLIQLSDLMRYMTYDSSRKFVELSKEIIFLKNYIDLQMLCFTNKNMVTFTVEGTSDNIYIPPMLFIPFLENAFKHSLPKEIDNNIQVSFLISEHQIIFEASNKYKHSNKTGRDKYSGIGLNVIKRRLELLYPNKHILDLFTDNNRFNVKLNLSI